MIFFSGDGWFLEGFLMHGVVVVDNIWLGSGLSLAMLDLEKIPVKNRDYICTWRSRYRRNLHRTLYIGFQCSFRKYIWVSPATLVHVHPPSVKCTEETHPMSP